MCRFSLALVCLVVAAGCTNGEDPFPSDAELSAISLLASVHTPPRQPTNQYADNPDAASLGASLFTDTRFSPCGISCAVCHPAPAYTVPLPVGNGCNGGQTQRNVIAILNAPFFSSDWYYWDGRKDSLWAHPMVPLLDPNEMASSPALVRQQLSASYASQYQKVFGNLPAEEVDDNRLLANFGKAIEAYIRRSLIKVDAPFDAKLSSFLTAAKNGTATTDPLYDQLRVFVRRGHCIICHKGPLFTDDSFHNLGVKQLMATDHGHLDGIVLLKKDPWNGGGQYSDDPGTGAGKLSTLSSLAQADLDGAFKTPSLRNVALTQPYMHTGAYPMLRDVIDFYNRGGDPVGSFPGTRATTIQPLNLTESEKQSLETLLQSLTVTQ